MTNVPILIFGLLCGLPIIYVASFFVILAKIAHKNKVTFSKVIQHFYKKMSIKNVAMYAAITSAIALCINFIFTANNDGGFISFLVTFDLTLLAVTAVWSFLGSDLFKLDAIESITLSEFRTNQFSYSGRQAQSQTDEIFREQDITEEDYIYDPAYSHMAQNIHNVDYPDWDENLTNANEEFDSNYEFSDNDDRNIDPAYSSMQSNIHHDI